MKGFLILFLSLCMHVNIKLFIACETACMYIAAMKGLAGI